MELHRLKHHACAAMLVRKKSVQGKVKNDSLFQQMNLNYIYLKSVCRMSLELNPALMTAKRSMYCRPLCV